MGWLLSLKITIVLQLHKIFVYLQRKTTIVVKHSFPFILFFLCFALPLCAETKDERAELKHEIRIGWGDQFFEQVAWHNPTHIVTTMPDTYRQTYKENYRYHQHLWFEYQRRPNHWFSYGLMFDMSEVAWDEVVRNGQGAEIYRTPGQDFYNIVLMPSIRFTYLSLPYFNMYLGMGMGLGVNGGTEKNKEGKRTDVGLAVDISIIGLSWNYKRWCWTIDAGGLYSIKNLNTIFLASSRILSVGIGVRL